MVACLLLLGCSGSGSTVTEIASNPQSAADSTQDTTPVDASTGIFNIPPPSELREVSYEEEDLFRTGSDYIELIPGQRFEVSEDNMIFTPDWDKAAPDNAGLSLVNYAFYMDGYDRDESLRFSWAQNGSSYRDGWVGIANWFDDSWNWYRLPEGDVMAADFNGVLRAEDRNMVITVLFIGDETWEMEYVRVGAPPGAPEPPENLVASQADYLDQISLSWDAPFGATGYLVYRDNQEEPIATLGDVTTYDDIGLGDRASHFYWVIATNEFGPSGFSERAEGWCAACLPPTDVEASDGLYVDRITVTWTKSESADGYQVFKDTLELPVATLGDVDTWDDMTVVDTGSHDYKIRGFNVDGYSKFSPKDSGYLGSPIPPVPPTNLQATDGLHLDRVELTWTKADDTIGYEIYRDLQVAPIAQVGDIDTWDDTTLVDTSEHTYWLKSINASGTSDFSNGDVGYLAACSPPTNVQATDGEYYDKIVITWDKSADAEGYKVYRDSKYVPPIATLGDVDTYDDTTIVDTGNHRYWVKGYTATGDSAFSLSDYGYMREIVVPDPPTNVQASDGTFDDRIQVTWDPVGDAQFYKIYRDILVEPLATVYDTTYDDTNLANYDTHEYWVLAGNSVGESDLSESDTGYMGTPSNPPSPPTNLQATDGEYNDKIRLTWTGSAGATGYKIYRDEQITPIDTVENVTSYDDTTVTDFDVHTYWVVAVNIAGDSGFSDPDTGYKTTEGLPPDPPTNLQASDGDYPTFIRLTWTKSDGASYYQIFRDLTVSPIETVGDVDTWDDTGIADDDVHTYWVKASDGTLVSGLSDPDTGYRGST